MKRRFLELQRFLDEDAFKYEADDDRQTIFFAFRDQHTYLVLLHLDDYFFHIRASPGCRVPDGARLQLADAVCRVNCGLNLGNFELNMDSGELRYHASAF